jgi:hypothetical protein
MLPKTTSQISARLAADISPRETPMKIRPLYLGCSLLLMVFQLRAAPETDRDALLSLSQNRLHTSSAQLAPIYHSSDWLAGLPSISLSHLGSLESHNNYEHAAPERQTQAH